MMERVQAVRGARSRDVRSDRGTSPEAVLEGMIQRRLLAVIRTKTPEQALAAAEAVAAGGILSLEVSVTMPEVDQVIKALAPRRGLTVGAGGVLNKEQAELALQAEAQFLVSPVGDVSLVPLCREAGAVSVIGALTPTEILAVHRAGADVVKIFPVDPLGGPRYLRAVLDPLPPLPLLVEGGVTLENLPDYLGLPIPLIALGEHVVVPRLVAKGVYAPITARARDLVLLVEKRQGRR